MLGEATDDYQFSLPNGVNVNTGYMYICTYQISVAVYRITLFLCKISRNMYRGNLQASAVWVLLLKGIVA
jgi:hypothetical protein